VVTCILFALLRPSPLALFWGLVCIGYWHISLFSQPRAQPPPISTAFGDFLPLLFVAYAVWRVAFRFVFPLFAARAPLEAMVLYLGPYWVGVLTNLTFDNIPIDRLLISDIKKRSGGIVSLVVIIVVLVVFALNQVRVIRKTGWLPKYLAWYIIGGFIVLVLALLPNLELRLHHYIIALALLPGTAFPTRISAMCQGVCLGLLLNGIAAWGFDSIVQTAAEVSIFLISSISCIAH
jgi:hypothetical protein